MKCMIVFSLITACALFGQSTQTDPTTRTIREKGKKDSATQDTTADAAGNPSTGTAKQKERPKRRQRKQTDKKPQ
jgi:hypothetical protein